MFANAAHYLGLPTVLVLALSGGLELQDFVWPPKGTLRERVALELERLRLDPFVGAFVPTELASADPAIQLFVAFLYKQLDPEEPCKVTGYEWMATLHRAAAGHAEAQLSLDQITQGSATRSSTF